MAGTAQPQRDMTGSFPAAQSSGSVFLDTSDGVRHYLDATTTVGRAEGNDVRIPDQTVSRFHAILRRSAGRWSVVDLDSSNGTHVNAERISVPRVLRPNDLVQFGDARFVFRSTIDLPTAQPTATYPALASYATAHYRLLSESGSFAEQQQQVIGERLERFDAVMRELFGIETASEPVRVFLLDQVADPLQPDRLMDSGGYTQAEKRTIYAVYRPESPGVDLERGVLDIFGLGVSGFAQWSPALHDGLLTFALRRAEPSGDDTDQWTPLLDALDQGSLPALPNIFSRSDAQLAAIDSLAIANFLDFAENAFGIAAVHEFLFQVGSAGAEAATRVAFRQPLSKVEKRWRARLKSTRVEGVRLFIKLLFPYLRPYRLKISEILVYITLSVTFGILLAKADGYLIDKALIPRDFHVFEVIMALLIGAFLLINATSLREYFLKASITERILRDMRLSMFRKVQSLHPGYFDRMDSGDIMSRLTNDLAIVESALSSGLVETIRMGLMFVVALAVIFQTQWTLAIIALIGIPLFFLVGRLLGRPVSRASIERQNDMASVTTMIHENLSAQPVIKLFGLQRLVSERFAVRLDKYYRSSLRMQFLGGLYGLSSNTITNLIELTVLGLGAYLVLHGRATTGTLFVAILLLSQIVMPMQMLSQLFQMVQSGAGSMKRINALVEARNAVEDAPNASELGRLAHEIRLEHVVFGYEDSRRVIENVSLTIPAGASVAIVGPSGSGKSTILNLLTRFYDPLYGRVLFDGVDVREATLDSVRGQIGMVFQDSILFTESIRENIRMGRPEASDDEVEEAARAAELHDFIQQLPEGYDTPVGERGGHLSGGQRQRIAIARAILRNPALLLLDEATSALDPATESAINATLQRLAAGRTTVSVTHRLASVTRADLIVVLDDGRLIEQGTHEELLHSDGLYARLWEEQQGHVSGAPTGATEAQLEVMRSIPLFAQLNRGLLDMLAAALVLERVDAGSVIVTAGEPGDRLYVINSGEVEVLAVDWDRRLRRLATLRERDYFGEIALVRDVPRTATVRARTSVELLSLSRDSFQTLLRMSPELRDIVQRTLVQREAELRELSMRQVTPSPGYGASSAV
ncbi:MAG TPA: ABC transporter transmembrane domain-containing protein [Nitrolancea sp.]|nr:ABC transporter transmembrane domain-containing protein [Nitrolancea sp.]